MPLTSCRFRQKRKPTRPPTTAKLAPYSVVRYDVRLFSSVAICNTAPNELPAAWSNAEGQKLRDRSRSHVCTKLTPTTVTVKQAFEYQSGTFGRYSGETAMLIG